MELRQRRVRSDLDRAGRLCLLSLDPDTAGAAVVRSRARRHGGGAMSTSKRTGRRVGLIVGAVLILGGFGYLAYGGLGENLVYFVTPAELMARGDDAYDTPVRLGGQVEPGSVVWDADALDLRFTLSDGDHAIEVRSSGAPPQMFRDGIGVVVEGRFSREGVF